MNIRAYTQDDFATLQRWAEARSIDPSTLILSPNGFVAEDSRGPIAMVWVFLVFDAPFVIVDNFFSRPQSSVRQVRDAWAVMFRVIKSFLANLRDCKGVAIKYPLIRTYCRAELGKFFKEDGWGVAERPSLQITYVLSPSQ